MKTNPFIVGALAENDYFIGRGDMIRKLNQAVDTYTGISLSGVSRIGKTSLVRRVLDMHKESENTICIFEDVGWFIRNDIEDPSLNFWITLAKEIRKRAEDKHLWSEELEKSYQSMIGDRYDYFTELREIIEGLRKDGCHIILAIDEFDGISRLFKKNTCHYQYLRTISAMRWASVILISRRTLDVLEVKTDEIMSTFHGVFSTESLRGFNENDMKEYYDRLKKNGVTLTEKGKACLEYYAGTMPYLLSKFGSEIIAGMSDEDTETTVDEDTVFEIYLKNKASFFDVYYEDLIRWLKEDGHFDSLIKLSLGNCLVSRNEILSMQSSGYLNAEETDEGTGYYAYTKDFWDYFSLKPLELPTWDMITAAEIKIKKIFAGAYPLLSELRYADIIGRNSQENRQRIDRKYSELNINWTKVLDDCRKLSYHKENPSILDGLSLGDVISRMINENIWVNHFLDYFKDDHWRAKLKRIRELRNPIAHAHEAAISEEMLAALKTYCDEIIKFNPALE